MQVRKVTLTVPASRVDFVKIAKEIGSSAIDTSEKIIEFLYSVITNVVGKISRRIRRREGRDPQVRRLNKFGGISSRKLNPQVLKISKILLLIGVTVLVIVGVVKLVGRISGTSSSSQPTVAGAEASQDIHREFAFPLRNGDNEEVSKIRYFIEKAELMDEIIVKGQRATAIRGRTFLIFTLKVTNEYDQAIEIDTRDYMRLIVNGNEGELLAPDIHNDPVEVQAISTKFTRLGFPINDTDENLVLRIGEISGSKEKIVLDLK